MRSFNTIAELCRSIKAEPGSTDVLSNGRADGKRKRTNTILCNRFFYESVDIRSGKRLTFTRLGSLPMSIQTCNLLIKE